VNVPARTIWNGNSGTAVEEVDAVAAAMLDVEAAVV
jgi:hypothetical protein